MLNEPFFQTDILNHIIKYMSFYLGFENWFLIFCGVLLFLYVCYKVFMYKNTVCYESVFPKEEYKFAIDRKGNIYAFVFLIFCISFNVWSLFAQELSFFSNYDTRGSIIPMFKTGGAPMWGVSGRFYPLAFWDTRIVYAITHHFGIINAYLNIQTLFIVWLLNCFLKFIPVWKRFICIGLVVLSPVFFSIGSIVFSERLLLIYIIGGFICMQKYSAQPDKKYFLWFAVLLINFALYSKELCVVFYFGIFLYYVTGHFLQGKIVPLSFLHPLKTARCFPFETLLFLSLLFFSGLYGANMPPVLQSSYVSDRLTGVYALYKLYYTEIAISVIVICFMIRNLFCKTKYTFMEGIALGSLFVTIFVVFILKIQIDLVSMSCKPYYLIVPHIMGLIYILWQVKHKTIYLCLSFIFFINSMIKNFEIYQKDDGYIYRTTAEAIISQNQTDNINIFMARHLEPCEWCIKSFILPYDYYWPHKHIRFFSSEINTKSLHFFFIDNIFKKEKPDSGDYFVIRKGKNYFEDLAQISQEVTEKIFENKFFEVYIIK